MIAIPVFDTITSEVNCMTNRQIEILRQCIYGVHFYNDVQGSDRGILMYLEHNGLVYTKALSPPVYRITQKGLAELQNIDDMEQKMRQNHAEQKAEKAKDRRFQLLNAIISAMVGAVFTLLVEHFDDVTAFFRRLF